MKKIIFSLVAVFALTFIGLSPSFPVKNSIPAAKADLLSNCDVDLYFMIDLSSSMNNNLSTGLPKITAAKQVITSVVTELDSRSNPSRYGYTAFQTPPVPGPDPNRPYPARLTNYALTDNAGSFNASINSLSTSGGTPIPSAFRESVRIIDRDWNRSNIPVAVLITDGVPTIDLDDYPYMGQKVSAVNIKNGNGNFLSPGVVNGLGELSLPDYPNTPYVAGHVLAHSMTQASTMNGIKLDPNDPRTNKQVKTHGVFLRGISYNEQIDKQDIVEYYAKVNDGTFFNVDDVNELTNAITNLLALSCGASSNADKGKLQINLPPSSIYEPKNLVIEGKEYTFNPVSKQFTGPNDFTVVTTIIDSGELASYEITISEITRGGAAILPKREKVLAFNRLISQFSAKAYTPPPATNYLLLNSLPVYDFKLSFTPTSDARTRVNELVNEVGIVAYEYADLADSNCNTVAANVATHICFKPKVSVVDFEGGVTGLINGSLYLKELVRLDQRGSIIIEGNVLGTNQIGGFVFPSSGNWLAVGGSFTARFQSDNSANNQLLTNYLQGPGSKLQWGSVSNPESVASKINKIIEDGANKGTTISSASYSGLFHLNSIAETNGATSSSFTTLPGGKIWYQDRSMTLNNISFRGFGTIVVNGNVTINGPVDCQTNARLGIIATGNITFNNQNIGCGSYVAAGKTAAGNIAFNSTISVNSAARGIFVAKGNISLPSVLEGFNYSITRDSDFARDPSALFRELLITVFSTAS